MAENSPASPQPSNPLRWFPEFWELGRRRLRPQARLLALSLLVGVIAGIGALAFHAACQVVVRYSLEAVAGYYPDGPKSEPPLFPERPPTVGTSSSSQGLNIVPFTSAGLSGNSGGSLFGPSG